MKPFDQKLYDQDDNAKEIVIEWLSTFDIIARVNPDPYGIDLLAHGPNGNYDIEVEVKHNWKGERFPFETVHFSARKTKFVTHLPNNIFVMLNHEWTYALIITGEVMQASKKIRKDTTYTKQEEFLQVQVSRGKVVRLH